MTREFTEEEIEWLLENPLGEGHTVTGSQNLAACDDCDFTAQGDTFTYLMEQVTQHLQQNVKLLDDESRQQRIQMFIAKFGWDPWAEKAIIEDPEQIMDVLDVTTFEKGPDDQDYDVEYQFSKWVPRSDGTIPEYPIDYEDPEEEEQYPPDQSEGGEGPIGHSGW